MPSDEAQAFYYAVYSTVQQIPYGKVTSYGKIAELINRPKNPRQVGQALKFLSVSDNSEFSTSTVPWWRVISSQGLISTRANHNDEIRQAEMLRSEAVEVEANRVDVVRFGWFPEEIDMDSE